MSGKCAAWVAKYGPSGRSGRAKKAVLIVIALRADANGEHARPGIAEMVESSNYSRSKVMEVLAELVAGGWLEVEERGRGRGHATVYRVVMTRGQTESQDVDDARKLDLSGPRKGPVLEEKRSSSGPEKVQFPETALLSSTVVINGRDPTPPSPPPAAATIATRWPPQQRTLDALPGPMVCDDRERAENHPECRRVAGLVLDEASRRAPKPLIADDRTRLLSCRRDGSPGLVVQWLQAGYAPDAIATAIANARTPTGPSITMELTKGRAAPRRGPPMSPALSEQWQRFARENLDSFGRAADGA